MIRAGIPAQNQSLSQGDAGVALPRDSRDTPDAMVRALSLFVSALIVGALACASPDEPAPHETYEVGSLMTPAMLKDQFGEEHHLDQSVELILFAKDMEGAKLIQDLLGSAEPELLEKLHAVYVADISRMPGIITRTRAIPKMKKRPYPTLLDRTGTVTESFPGEEGKATLIRLEKLRVWEIENVSTEGELRAAIGN